MPYCRAIPALVAAAAVMTAAAAAPNATTETRARFEKRMAWWKDARFGLFIHWGLYSTTNGVWGDRNGYGEWILDSARIPVREYEKLRDGFNPVKFDADAWARMAKRAGMKYVVITTKHHDGFCLWDSKSTDYDVMSTPFRRDVMKELAEACRKHGLRICWYHSIMDWHHPDYLPRRPWEDRSADSADFSRYVSYINGQVKELLTGYGDIGVMWFDGQWEATWMHEHGQALYDLCRAMQPNVIVNNRVDKGPGGILTTPRFAGDYGTPEQEIPETGVPGAYWETCMTMNRHWGWNAADSQWKSAETLVRNLVDVASKGGNYLLNVGPTGLGEFPPLAVERLEAIGRWMDVNGESINGTEASPLAGIAWGRCTWKPLSGGRSRLYLHVFDWPEDGILTLSPLMNNVVSASLLAAPSRPIAVQREGAAVTLSGLGPRPDAFDSVLAVDIEGAPVAPAEPPVLVAGRLMKGGEWVFLDSATFAPAPTRRSLEVRYTLDGTTPSATSPLLRTSVTLQKNATLKLRHFMAGKPVGDVRIVKLHRETALPSVAADTVPGLSWAYFEGDWQKMPDFKSINAVASGTTDALTLGPRKRDELFAMRFTGYLDVPANGVYTLATESDDGSILRVDGRTVVDNDGMHGSVRVAASVALKKGLHRVEVDYLQGAGSFDLVAYWAPRGKELTEIPATAWRRSR